MRCDTTEVVKTTYCGPYRGGGLASWSLVESEAHVVKVQYGNCMWSVPIAAATGKVDISPETHQSELKGLFGKVLMSRGQMVERVWSSGPLTS